MAAEGETTRARIQTYVPAYQKEEWNRHAADLDMSLSEFVRSMVQAGRSGFESTSEATDDEKPAGSPSSRREPQGTGLEDRVRQRLSEDEYIDWDELLASVTENVEDRLETTVHDLEDRDEIRYSGRHGGYRLE